MNIKKLLLIFGVLLLAGTHARADVATEDGFTLSSVELTPGGDYAVVTVSLAGSRLYTGYNLDITLPEGLAVDYYNGEPDVSIIKDPMYPYTEDRGGDKTYTHSLSCSYGVIGPRVLRLACSSASNQNLKSTSGDLFRFAVIASPYAKPGIADITITGQALAAVENGEVVQYTPADKHYEDVTVLSGAKAPLTISAANQFSTCILPFAAALPEGVKAYTCTTSDADYLYLSEATRFEAFTPYIIYSESGYSGTLEGTVDADGYQSVVTSGLLRGAIAQQQISEGYVMQNQGEGARFYRVDGTNFTIPAGKCWAEVTGSAPSKGFFDFSDATKTGANAPAAVRGDATVRDLNGNIVTNPKKGNIYIINNQPVYQLRGVQ